MTEAFKRGYMDKMATVGIFQPAALAFLNQYMKDKIRNPSVPNEFREGLVDAWKFLGRGKPNTSAQKVPVSVPDKTSVGN